MTTKTYEYLGVLNVIDCAGCGISFGVTPRFQQDRRDDHKRFYCPKGCHNFYPQQSDEERLRKEKAVLERKLANAESREAEQRRAREATERSNRALKGHLTRWRKRIGQGVCPVAGCKRHFPNVQSHVATVHPDWLAAHPEVFEDADG